MISEGKGNTRAFAANDLIMLVPSTGDAFHAYSANRALYPLSERLGVSGIDLLNFVEEAVKTFAQDSIMLVRGHYVVIDVHGLAHVD